MNATQVKKAYLTVYRTIGFSILAGGLLALIMWGILILFFMVNYSWIAPTVLSPTSDKMIQFNIGYQQAFQNEETLLVAESQSERDVQVAADNLKHLQLLGKEVMKYDDDVVVMSGVKRKELLESYALRDQLEVVKDATKKSQKVALITNEEAVQTITAIQQFHNSVTDGNIALGTYRITAQAQAVVLVGQIEQAQSDLQTKKDTLLATRRSLKVAGDTLTTLKQSSYYDALNSHGSNLAFIPYDNIKIAKVGLPVYDCYLMIIACHQVGTIRQVYHDEQVIDFPLFNVRLSRTVRGILVDMDVTTPKYMGSSIMFVGKPLFL